MAHTPSRGCHPCLQRRTGRICGHTPGTRAATPIRLHSGAGAEVKLAGLLHDAGKIRPEFQAYLRRLEAGEKIAHNIACSVVILDAAQALPVELLRPTTDVLGCLVQEYGCTVIFCTATQPALEEAPALREFHSAKIPEIVPGYAEYFDSLQRVDYEIRRNPQPWSELAGEISCARLATMFSTGRRYFVALTGTRH